MNATTSVINAAPSLVARSSEFLDAGTAYLHAADRDHRVRQRFGAVATINIACLAVENLLYGLCLAWGILPEGSCLHSLSTEAARNTPFSSSDATRAAELSGLLDVCSLAPETNFDHLLPEDAEQALVWGRELEQAVHRALPPSSPASTKAPAAETPPCSTPI
jgi:hypothetical protein